MNHWVPAQAETSTQTHAMNMIAASRLISLMYLAINGRCLQDVLMGHKGQVERQWI